MKNNTPFESWWKYHKDALSGANKAACKLSWKAAIDYINDEKTEIMCYSCHTTYQTGTKEITYLCKCGNLVHIKKCNAMCLSARETICHDSEVSKTGKVCMNHA